MNERLEQLLSDLVRDAQRMADGEESAEMDVDRGMAAIRGLREGVDVERLIAVARELVMGSVPYHSAIESEAMSERGMDDIHRNLREALGISEQEWRKAVDLE